MFTAYISFDDPDPFFKVMGQSQDQEKNFFSVLSVSCVEILFFSFFFLSVLTFLSALGILCPTFGEDFNGMLIVGSGFVCDSPGGRTGGTSGSPVQRLLSSLLPGLR